MEELRDDPLEEEEDLSEHSGRERVEPSVKADPRDSVGDLSSDLCAARLLGGDSQGYAGRSAIRGGGRGVNRAPRTPCDCQVAMFTTLRPAGHWASKDSHH